MNIQELFEERCQKPREYADIWEHLPTLSRYAQEAKHITEFGVRSGNSTTGFLHGLSMNGGTLDSYDKNKTDFTPPIIEGVTWTFTQADTGSDTFFIPSTDVLFIDSDHTYEHVTKEFRFADRVRKYIIMHDTAFAWREFGGDGVWNAKRDFLTNKTEWRVKEHFENCNGLTIMERVT